MRGIRKLLSIYLILVSVVASAAPQQEHLQPIHLSKGQISINGQALPGSFSVSKTNFKFLYFYVPSQGLFIISNKQFTGAIEAGKFERRQLRFSVAGIDFKLVSSSTILETTSEPAWVRFDPNFKLNLQSTMFGYGDRDSTPYDWPNQIGN